MEAFPSKGVRKVFLKCVFPLGHPSLVLGGALLWPQKRDVWSSYVLVLLWIQGSIFVPLV